MLKLNISIFSSLKNDLKWEFKIIVYFMSINIIDLFYSKEKNLSVVEYANHEIYNNKK